MKQNLRDLLPQQLGHEFFVRTPRDSTRRLILSDVGENLQAGIVVQRSKRRGVFGEVVDIGVRIPSVEDLYDQYELHAMLQMGFKKPKPVGWLTFWRPTYSSLDLEEQGLGFDAIMRDFNNLFVTIREAPQAFRNDALACLCSARLPAWATMPGSSFLIIKALIARILRDPGTDARGHIAELTRNQPTTRNGDANIERFCDWLRSAKPEHISA